MNVSELHKKTLLNSLNQGFDIGNSPYQKLWTHLDYREKRGLSSTISFTNSRGILCPGYFAGRGGSNVYMKVFLNLAKHLYSLLGAITNDVTQIWPFETPTPSIT